MISTTGLVLILSCSSMVSITVMVLRIKLCIEYTIPQQWNNFWDRSQYDVLPYNVKDTKKCRTKSYKIRKRLSDFFTGAATCMMWLLDINIYSRWVLENIPV